MLSRDVRAVSSYLSFLFAALGVIRDVSGGLASINNILPLIDTKNKSKHIVSVRNARIIGDRLDSRARSRIDSLG